MRTNIRRNTGREVTKCSFQIDVKDIDLVEKISKRRMVSQSEILRESVLNYIRNWRRFFLSVHSTFFFLHPLYVFNNSTYRH